MKNPQFQAKARVNFKRRVRTGEPWTDRQLAGYYASLLWHSRDTIRDLFKENERLSAMRSDYMIYRCRDF